jgi:hypothetical protein
MESASLVRRALLGRGCDVNGVGARGRKGRAGGHRVGEARARRGHPGSNSAGGTARTTIGMNQWLVPQIWLH